MANKKYNISSRVGERVFNALEEKRVKGGFEKRALVVRTVLKEYFGIRPIKSNNCSKSIKRNNLSNLSKTKEVLLKSKKENKEYYEPLLKTAKAKFINKGIYELKGFLCYPSTGKAMNKTNNKERLSIEEVLNKK